MVKEMRWGEVMLRDRMMVHLHAKNWFPKEAVPKGATGCTLQFNGVDQHGKYDLRKRSCPGYSMHIAFVIFLCDYSDFFIEFTH